MRTSLILPLLFGLAGTAVLVWLGVWQLQRLEWKRGVLAEIDARIAAEPSALPAEPDATEDRYRPVQVTGVTGQPDILVLVSVKGLGPGFRVIAPFTTKEGREILLDRGYLSAHDRDVHRPPVGLEVAGNLHWPDEIDIFTPEPDIAAGLWFARDVPGMAAELGTEPVLVVARDVSTEAPGIRPLPVDSAGIANNHLQYAVTWFGLAAVWVVMTGYYLHSRRRGTA